MAARALVTPRRKSALVVDGTLAWETQGDRGELTAEIQEREQGWRMVLYFIARAKAQGWSLRSLERRRAARFARG